MPRVPSTRSLPTLHRSTPPILRPFQQRRWARVHDVRFVTTQHQTPDRVTERYRSKLDQKAKEKGLNDIGQLKEVYRDKITDLKRKASVPGVTDQDALNEQAARSSQPAAAQHPSPPSVAAQANQANQASPQGEAQAAAEKSGVKTLSSFLDLEKAKGLPKRELESVWRLRHANSPQSLCAAIPTPVYESIARTAKQHPQFILPGLPADSKTDDSSPVPDTNAEDSTSSPLSQPTEPATSSPATPGTPIHFLQWTFPSPTTATVLFTHLSEYKVRGAHAQPHTTLTHHLDLADSHQRLVLCEGAVMPDRGVSMDEARWLVLQLQKFYNLEDVTESEGQEKEGASGMTAELKRRRKRLVEKFSKGDPEFKIEELVEEAERLG